MPTNRPKTAKARKKSNGLLSTKRLAEANSVSVRTVERWTQVGILPPPLRVNGRKFWPDGTLPKFD
jgi:predicted site-specific integrase-resolvase